MIAELARKWWVLLLNGICAIIFGIIAFTWPHITLLVLAIVYGIYSLVDGITMISAVFARNKRGESWGHLLFHGIISIVAGLIALLWPAITAIALLIVIAIWAIIRGISEILTAIRLRKFITNEWLLVLGGVISILFGLLLFARPRVGALSVVWLIGLFAIVHGIILIAFSFKLHNLGRIAHAATM